MMRGSNTPSAARTSLTRAAHLQPRDLDVVVLFERQPDRRFQRQRLVRALRDAHTRRQLHRHGLAHRARQWRAAGGRRLRRRLCRRLCRRGL